MAALMGLRRGLDKLLEVVAALLMVALSLIIIMGFLFRAAGYALSWYDEIASIGLCWLTYYAGALAALRGAHIGFPGIVNAMAPGLRLAVTLAAEVVVIFFFGVLAVTGLEVLDILEGSTLVSLPQVSLQITQSVIPITAILFIVAELLRLPEVIAAARQSGFVDHELQEALQGAARAPAAQER